MLTRLIMLIIIATIAFAIKRHFMKGKNQSTYSNAYCKQKGTLSRKEALHILGLTDPATNEDIQHAYKRLIFKVHPDKGGTDFFASQLNLAKDILLDSSKDQT